MTKLATFIATFGGTGHIKKAPGTMGSLASMIFALLFFKNRRTLRTSFFIACLLGLWSAHKAGKGHDHKWIVIDETAGMWLSLMGFWPHKKSKTCLSRHLTFKSLIAFAIFRFFDITKVGPIKTIDKYHNSWAIMGDDLLAGLFTQLITKCLFRG